MEEIKYIGERLWAGHLGNAFVVLSFTACLLSFFFYWLSFKNKEYLGWARRAFVVHGISVLGIAGTLFFMLFNHYFEYQYVWQHSSKSLDMKYIFSCFWEGQEGSFLLWTFWNMVLGMILKRQLRQSEWEASVMTFFTLAQVFLASMLLGVYIFDYKIGSNPFLLLREHDQFRNMPFVQIPNYLHNLDGKGLNSLLQNYWMTIHPPTLFLGFASTLLPFSFSVAALWRRDYSGWQNLALPWTYFGILVLGVGILMGGAWAYEALNFGGFWAWDPVENSSLVPWLVLVAAGHTMLINKHKGGSLFTTHFLAIGSFLLVLYSTFLTRSGILGKASVHAFTDLGMTGQLVMYVLTFIFISVTLLIKEKLFKVSYIIGSLLIYAAAAFIGYKKILLMVWLGSSAIITMVAYGLFFPKEKEEEDFFSREFYIFLGSLALLLAGLIITYFTSIPVLNELFGTDYAPVKVPVYNKWMIPFAWVLLGLIAMTLFLKYQKNDPWKFTKRLAISWGLAILFGLSISIPMYMVGEGITKKTIAYTGIILLGLFAVFSNADYAFAVLKGKIRKAGAAIAHMGFALILLGAVISTSKKTVLSKNTSDKKVSELGEGFDDKVSIFLTKGDTLPMGPYLVSYEGKERKGKSVYFKVNYYKMGADSQPVFDFSLHPRILERSPEPDTKHYLNRDIYTHVTAAELSTPDSILQNKNAYGEAQNYIGHVGDTIFAKKAFVIIDSIKTNINRKEYEKNDSLLIVTAVLKAVDAQSNVYYAHPKYVIKKNVVIPEDDVIDKLGLKFVFWKINPDEGSLEITMAERIGNAKDFIVMEAYMFPYINLLWLGCVIMAIGTAIAVIERIRLAKRKVKSNAVEK